MSLEYKCNEQLSNLGNQDCFTKIGTIRRIIFVPTYKADGTVNEFANEAAVTKSALQAKFDAVDIQDRFFPTCELQNVEQSTEDPKVETDDYGFDFFIRHGVKSFKCMMWGVFYNYLRRMSKLNYVNNMSCFPIDNKGNLIYKKDSATGVKVQPIPLRSIYIGEVDAKADGVFKGALSFKYDLEGDDKYLIDYIDRANLNFDGLSTVDVYSLYDVTLTVTNPTTTTFALSAYLDGKTDQPHVGLLKTDLVAVVAGSPEVPATLVDAGDGTYTGTWTVSSGAGTVTATKARYSFSTSSFNVPT